MIKYVSSSFVYIYLKKGYWTKDEEREKEGRKNVVYVFFSSYISSFLF